MKIQILLLIILLICIQGSYPNICYNKPKFLDFQDTNSYVVSNPYSPTRQEGPVTDSAFYFDYPESVQNEVTIRSHYQNWNKHFSIYFWIKLTKQYIYDKQYVYFQDDIKIYFQNGQIYIEIFDFYTYFSQTILGSDWNLIVISNEQHMQSYNYRSQIIRVLFNDQELLKKEFYGPDNIHMYQYGNAQLGKQGQNQNFIIDDFTVQEGVVDYSIANCMMRKCQLPCTNNQEFCTQQSQFCGWKYNGDEENSAKITFIKTYSDQVTSPLKWKTDSGKLQEQAYEYGYQYWFKWDYLWKDNYQFDFDYFSQKIELSFLSENEDSAFEDDQIGNKSLCLWLDFTGNDRIIQASTYNKNPLTYDQHLDYIQIQNNDFDSTWMFINFSYSAQQQKAAYSVQFQDRDYFQHKFLTDIEHEQIYSGHGLFFRLANTHNGHRAPGFQGFYKDVKFNYGQQGIFKDDSGFKSLLHNMKSPYKPLTSALYDLTLTYDGDTPSLNQVIDSQASYYPKFNLDYPIEYNIHGWFKLPIGFNSAGKKSVIYKVATKNTAKSTNRSLNDIGDHTFYAWIEDNKITFETYSVADIHRPQTQGVSITFNISQDQIENDFYFYQGYSKEAGMAVTYVKPYDSTTGVLKQHPSEANDKVIHMRSSDYKIYLGGDGESHIPQAVFTCVKFQYGTGSFISSPEDNLHTYQISEECVQEGDKSSYETGKEYSLESYNTPGFYMSHGSPSYLTDSPENIGNFELVDGLVGDSDTVSLRSTYEIENEERQDFYWRHADFKIREMQNDESDAFAADASFIIHKDLFVAGTIALESVNNRGHYVRHMGNQMILSQIVQHQDFYHDASWKIVDSTGSQTPSVKLMPVYRLQHPETLDIFITIDDNKVEIMNDLGYKAYNQPAKDGEQETNVIGYAYNAYWDSYTTAVFEFKNQETQTHYYTTNANDCPQGFVLNVIAFYAYPINYERTIAVQQYTYVENDKYIWTTSYEEVTETLNDITVYTYQQKQFWIYGKDDDVCLHDISQCGPPIPEPCEHPYQYRPNQSSECIECFGEVNHYDHSEGVISQFYTATCEPCEGGQYSFNQDEFGNRTCIECPFGTKHGDTCYLHCDTETYKYLDIETMECTQCDGVLQPHPNGIENLKKCVPCDRVDMKRECKQGSQPSTYVISPNVCPSGHEQIREFRVCSDCPLEKDWVLNTDDGRYYCIQSCEDENHYVNDQGQCSPCVDGFLYDDGTGAKKCAPNTNVNFEPITVGHDENLDFTYEVPEDQIDDVKEFGFWMWIRPQFLSPKKFDFHQSKTQKKRIGGFSKIDKNHNDDQDISFSDEHYGMSAYIQEHDDPEQENENIMFSTFSEDIQNTFEISREDYEYEWIFIFMAQQVTQQRRCSYLHAAKSQTYHFTHNQASEINFDTHKLVFYAGRQFYLNNFANMGFQGQYYNIELRFGYNGIYQDSYQGFQNYFSSQNQPLSMVPVTVTVTDKYDITPENQYIQISELSEEEKTSYLENLHGTQRFAVYGWFKSENTSTQKRQLLFNIQDIYSNQENTQFQQAYRLGDLSLSCWLYQDNLSIMSYSTSSIAEQAYTSTAYERKIPFSNDQYTNWFFLYWVYDRNIKDSWGYYQNILTNEKFFEIINYKDVWHFRPDQQVLKLGLWPHEQLDERYYENFDGQVYNIKLQYHNTCEYEDFECVEQLAYQSTPTPSPWGQCVIMYDQPNYQGNFISVCDKNNSYNMEVNSIYIPEGIEFTIWEQKHFHGLTVVYELSQPNIVDWDFTLLLQDRIHGAKIIKNKSYYEFIGKQEQKKDKQESLDNQSYVESDDQQDLQEPQIMTQTSMQAQSMSKDMDIQEYNNMEQLKSKSTISHQNPAQAYKTTETNANDKIQTQVAQEQQQKENMQEQKVEKTPQYQQLKEDPIQENTVVYDISSQQQDQDQVAPQVDDKLNEVESVQNTDDSQVIEQQEQLTETETTLTADTDQNDDVVALQDKKEDKKKSKKESKKEKDTNQSFLQNNEEDSDQFVENILTKKSHLRRN